MDDKYKIAFKTEEEKRAVQSRLNRVRGQLDGINKMVQADKYCEELLMQIVSAESALKGLSNYILEGFIRSSFENEEKINKEKIEYIVEICKRFNN